MVLRPSRALAATVAAFHLLALGAAASTLSGVPLALICAGLAVSGACATADALLRLPGSVVSMELREDGSGRWHDKAGREHPVTSARATWVGAGVVVLGLRSTVWRTRWLVLLPDSAAADDQRRLRVWLKWRPA
jgi:toxin CptA